MKIGIIGAAGQSGVLLVEEALKQGHEVTAIVRDSNKVSNKEVAIIEKDLFALVLGCFCFTCANSNLFSK